MEELKPKKTIWTHSQQLTLRNRVEQARERFRASLARCYEVWERTERREPR